MTERTDRPTLYSFRRCPYAMRARMALIVSKQTCTIREILLRDKPAAMLEASAKGTVPVLVLPDGRVLDESLDIMRWALDRHDPEGWRPETPEVQATVDALVADNDGPFKHHLDRYKYATRYEDADPVQHRVEAEQFITKLEQRLAATPFLLGDHRSFADVAIMPFVRQFAHADRATFEARPFPNIQRWLSAFLETPLFKDAMTKFDVWQPDAVPVCFPPSPPSSTSSL